MKKRTFGCIFAAALICVALLTACSKNEKAGSQAAADTKVFELKMGHMTTEQDPYHLGSVEFKRLMEAESNGRMKITIYPNAQLGYDRDLIEGLQFGTIDFAYVTSSPLGNFIPGFAALDMPFLFRGWDHVENVLKQPYMQTLYKTGEEKSLIPLSLLPRGFRSVTNSKRPIRSPADMRGIKIRVIESPVFVTTFEALGATVTAMSWGEVFTALQQGAIDAQENSIDVIKNERVFEVQKYTSLTEHIFAMTTLVASKTNFDKLPADLQEMVRRNAIIASRVIGEDCRNRQITYTNELKGLGMEFNDVDKTAFRPLVQKTYDDFLAKSSQDIAVLIKNIEATPDK